MGLIWTTVDRLGRSVTLHDDVWAHVLDGHEDMHGLEFLVRNVVEHPDFIKRDRKFADRTCIYRQIEDDGLLLKFVVAFSASGESIRGRAITAYMTRRDSKEEKRLWP